MGRTIFDFVKDTSDGFVSLQDFYQGICNLYEQLAASSPVSPERQLLPHREQEQEDLRNHPQLLAAICFHNIVKAVFPMHQVARATFHYDTTSQAKEHAIDSTLLSALRAMAFTVNDDGSDSHLESPDQMHRSRTLAVNDLAAGAYFSARSLRCLEPQGNTPRCSMSPQINQNHEGKQERGAERQEAHSRFRLTNTVDMQEEARGVDYSSRSLGEMIESFNRIRHDSFEGDASCEYRRAMANWCYLVNDDNLQRLRPLLSMDQITTARLLLEWWGGSIDFKASSEISRTALLQSALTGVSPTSFAKLPNYQKSMLRLFDAEFLPRLYGPDGLKIRPVSRRAAARIAAAQRLAISVCKSLHAQHGIAPSNLEFQHSQSSNSGVCRPEEDGEIGASLSSCGWLQDAGVQHDMPYYLWDIKQRRTVVSHNLGHKVEYNAVSHTWGRWKKDDSPSVRVEGIDEWLIPQNTKFNVADLPEILSSAPLVTPFVWFDLLCIPQGPSTDELKKISRDEIGRQARIFRGAKFAAAWLNDVDGWEGLHVAFRQISIQFLQNDYQLPASLLDLAGRDRDVDLELLHPTSTQPQTVQSDVFGGEMNGWFSSLWTLQELCLRPDMRLFNRQWNVFAVGEKGETVVRMDDLVALMEQSRVQRSIYLGPGSQSALFMLNDDCKSTAALSYLLGLTGLGDLPNASRSTILALGNQRYCKKNRAVAIMSALGVTDWYGAAYNQQDSEGDETGSTDQHSSHEYPLSFLREAATKIGAEFYASAFPAAEINVFLIEGLFNPSPRRSLGTMLPFGTSPVCRTRTITEGLWGPDHPSVKTWTLQPDYSVDITQAGIISYTGQPRPERREIIVVMIAPSLEGSVSLSVEDGQIVDLDQWIDSYLPQTRNFAVCLHYERPLDGLLLKEILNGDLVKVGVFCVRDPNRHIDRRPQTYQVNWHVL